VERLAWTGGLELGWVSCLARREGWKGLEADLGSWARAVGDLGGLTVEWSWRWGGGLAASSG